MKSLEYVYSSTCYERTLGLMDTCLSRTLSQCTDHFAMLTSLEITDTCLTVGTGISDFIPAKVDIVYTNFQTIDTSKSKIWLAQKCDSCSLRHEH